VFLDISYLLATVVCHEVALVTPSQFASVVKSFLGKKKHRQLPRGQVKSTPQSQPPSEEDLPSKRGRRDHACRPLLHTTYKNTSMARSFEDLTCH
jgi:hypothetical protein